MQKTLEKHYRDAGIYCGNIAAVIPARLREYLPEKTLLVCDPNTHRALAHRLSSLPQHRFEKPPHADMQTVQTLRHAAEDFDALLAVGSGTLNDLCKYAAHLDGKPYAVTATAPSMNGYVSANASIRDNGFKKTLPATAPRLVLCDIPTLGAAPKQLIQAGIGDTLCRSTIQADWLLSHLLTESRYIPQYFEWLIPYETQLLENPHDITALIHGLLTSGLAMREFGSSEPASQGEHMLAHTMEMLFPELPEPYHGEAIAVTTLTMARKQEAILARETPPTIRYVEANRFTEYLPAPLVKQARLYYARKFPNTEVVARLNKQLSKNWNAIRQSIQAVTLPHSLLLATLQKAGCPTKPSDLGWPQENFDTAIHAASLTRDRLTFLDLTTDTNAPPY